MVYYIYVRCLNKLLAFHESQQKFEEAFSDRKSVAVAKMEYLTKCLIMIKKDTAKEGSVTTKGTPPKGLAKGILKCVTWSYL